MLLKELHMAPDAFLPFEAQKQGQALLKQEWALSDEGSACRCPHTYPSLCINAGRSAPIAQALASTQGASLP